jgi:cupin fold WbuC family metalloprotein
LERNFSEILLHDESKVLVDEGGRSVGFFCRSLPARVDNTLIEEMVRESETRGKKNLRLCLHSSSESAFHTMLIVEHKGKHYPPHRHLEKGECFHIIKGQLAVFSFDEEGGILDACLLEPDGYFLYRVELNMYHAVMPLSDVVVYHESKPGPFLGDSDAIPPKWAPAADDPDAIRRYEMCLMEALNMQEKA